MACKARRRPSWKRWKKLTKPDNTDRTPPSRGHGTLTKQDTEARQSALNRWVGEGGAPAESQTGSN